MWVGSSRFRPSTPLGATDGQAVGNFATEISFMYFEPLYVLSASWVGSSVGRAVAF